MIDNLNHYRVFLTVAETVSISRAAERLFISQPAVSKSVKNLEDALSVHLIERSSRGIRLTEQGKLLYEHLQEAFQNIHAAEEELRQANDLGIGYSEQLVLNRAFYSARDTKTPMLINVVCLLLNALLSFIFVRIWDANGLALAYSVAGIASMVLLSIYLKKRIGMSLPWREIMASAVKTLLASGAMLLALFRLDDLLDDVLPVDRKVFQLLEVGILFVVGVAVFFIVAILLKMREVQAVKSIFMRKFKKS